MADSKLPTNAELQQQIEQLQTQLAQSQENEKRALADYKNLVRRNQEERARTIEFALAESVSTLLEPLGNLSLAADTIDDQGLKMVVAQFWQKLAEFGLEEIPVLDKPFNLEEMEAAEIEDGATTESGVVVKVLRRGYKLNGRVIQHARVVIGVKK